MAPSPWPPGAWHEAAVRQAFDVLLDPLVLFTAVRDDAGRIVDFVYAEANQAACEYNLMSRDELVGSRLLDLLPGHRESGLFAAYVDVVETGRPLSLDGLAYTPEVLGEQRWFDVRAVKVGDGLSYTWRDVTGRIGEVQALREAQAEAARAREAEEATSLSMDAAVIGMAIVSPDLRFRRVNAAFARMLGYTPAQLATMTFTDITHPDDIPRGHDDVARLQRGEIESFHERKRYLTAWGQTLWVDLFVAAARNADGTMHHHVAQVVDVTAEVVSAAALTRTVDTLEDLATHDPLTGLVNRRFLEDRLREVLGHSPRAGSGTAVLFADVDRLKPVNDSFGHAAGDQLLAEVAARLEAAVRGEDIVARVGGDEFVVVLVSVRDEADVRTVVEQVRERVEAPARLHPALPGFDDEGVDVPVSLSVGWTMAAPFEDPASVVARADAALYRAKAGRARIARPRDGGLGGRSDELSPG